MDSALAADPIDMNDSTDPIDPTDSTEPTDPTDMIDPFDPMHRNESSDHSDHREFLDAIGPRLVVGAGAGTGAAPRCAAVIPGSRTCSPSDLSG